MIPVFVINLARDIARRARIEAQLTVLPELEPIFVPAVDGAALPDQVCELLSDSTFWATYKGAIGCFLSHTRVWELLAEQTVPYAVVLEDDADITGLQALSSFNLPDDFDIIFINERMSPKVEGKIIVGMVEALPIVDFANAGFGTDGYILTPSGAKKLLCACVKDLYFGHIDGRLARYATSSEDLIKLGDAPVAQVIRNHHHQRHLPELGLLKGCVMAMPLVRHSAGPSSRAAIDVQLAKLSNITQPTGVQRYDFATMTDPPEEEGVLKFLEAPKTVPRKMPEFVADFSGRGLTLNSPAVQHIHGSYLVQRRDALLFGPNHLVTPQGHWSCEARTYKRQFLWYMHEPFYGRMYPGAKPIIDYKGPELKLTTSIWRRAMSSCSIPRCFSPRPWSRRSGGAGLPRSHPR